MSNPDASRIGQLIYQSTGIPTLDELFKNPDAKSLGIAYLKELGFFAVVFGGAGSGKSVLTLQMSCGMLQQDEKGETKHVAIYLTQEKPSLIATKVRDFGFLKRKDGLMTIHLDHKTYECKDKGEFVRKIAVPEVNFETPGLHVVSMPLDVATQTAVLQNVFSAVAQHGKNGGPGIEHSHFVCVDNAETIDDEAYLVLASNHHKLDDFKTKRHVRRRRDQNFFKVLREHCGRHGINCLFAFEEHATEGRQAELRDLTTTAQAYAADVVIRLGSHLFEAGYKERSLEILKAKNQAHVRGRQHFSIVDPRLQVDQMTQAATQSGIVIYRSQAAQLFDLRHINLHQRASEVKGASQYACGLGIPELDAAVKVEIKRTDQYLQSGSVAVLVSDLDVRANDIALHFAFGNRPEKPTPLFLSLVHPVEVVRQELDRYDSLSGTNLHGENFCHFGPEHISEGKLLLDITRRLRGPKGERCPGRRVVVDNLFGLESRWPLVANMHHFIDTLFSLFRDQGVIALVVDMVEVGEGRNPIDKSYAAGLADTVMTLRHVELNSRAHTAFAINKLYGQHTPEKLWDLVERSGNDGGKYQLGIASTFDYYKGLLSGKPEPVGIILSLHTDAPGSPQEKYLARKQRAMESATGLKLSIQGYQPDAYVHFQSSLPLTQSLPLADCHILSIDEIWLHELMHNESLEDLATHFSDDEKKDNADWPKRGSYVTASHDIALLLSPKPASMNVAIPVRNNCGVLCYDRRLNSAEGAPLYREGGNDIEKFYLKIQPAISGKPIEWTDLLDAKTEYDRSIQGAKPPFFTFCMDQQESCVSFLIELALGVFKDAEKILSDVNDSRDGASPWKINLKSSDWTKVLEMLTGLLDKADLELLALGRFRPTQDERDALFSRQWFNIWAHLHQSRPHLVARELPVGIGNSRRSIPVSGAWYLGILKGSVAVEAGTKIIAQFGQLSEDRIRAVRGINLPVCQQWYGTSHCPMVLDKTPYTNLFRDLAKWQGNRLPPLGKDARKVRNYLDNLREKGPFYRTFIRDYRKVAPILYRMMGRAAQARLRESAPKMKGIVDEAKQAVEAIS